MVDAPAEQSSPQWFAYTWLGQYGYAEQNWFSEKGFATQQDAEAFLDGPAHDWPESRSRSNNGWRGPIKLEPLSGHGDYFTGPWLADVLKDADFDSQWTWEQRFKADFEACAADVVPRVMGRMEANGELPSEAPLTSEHHRLVQRRLKNYELPEIECRLGADWDFEETEMNARLLAAHRTPNGTLGYERRLFAAAVEIEDLARLQHGDRIRAIDVCHLWTSLDLWLHLVRFCREGLWVPEGQFGHRADERLIESARYRFCSRLGSYVLRVQNSLPRQQAIGSTMAQEASWEDLSKELKRISRGAEPLRADWFAYAGSENYGIWIFHLDGRGTEECRAALGLIAARAIAKLRMPPIPIPQPMQHLPAWKDYCDVLEELARLEGKSADYSDAVPAGLGTADRDAVDPGTRAWLELLRRESTAFRSHGRGTMTIKGTEYPSVSGTISDVCGASAVYCMRRARDEIGAQLIRNSAGRPAASGTGKTPESAAAEEQPIRLLGTIQAAQTGSESELAAPVSAPIPAVSNFAVPESAAIREGAIVHSTGPASPPDPTRPEFIRQPKPPIATEQRNKSWPYPKELYHDGGSYRVVHSPEEHGKAVSEGWSDVPTGGMTYVPWSAEEPVPKAERADRELGITELGPTQTVEQHCVQASEPTRADHPTQSEPAVADSGTESSKSVGPRSRPPRRTPDIETSRERIELRNRLATELATIKPDLGRYCTPVHLKKKYPNFELWKMLQLCEIQELIDGDQLKPTAYAGHLALRKYGLTSLSTIKKDQEKLRKAKAK